MAKFLLHYNRPVTTTLHSASFCHATLRLASVTLHSATSCHATLGQYMSRYILYVPSRKPAIFTRPAAVYSLQCLALLHLVTLTHNYMKGTTDEALHHVTSSIHLSPLYFQTFPSAPAVCALRLHWVWCAQLYVRLNYAITDLINVPNEYT